MNFQFAYPWVLLLLVPLALFAALSFYQPFKQMFQGTFVFAQTSNLKTLTKSFRASLASLPKILTFIALALCIIAMARPQTSDGDDIHVEGIDIFLALDMSGSMQAIDISRRQLKRKIQQDEKPSNRFQTAKNVLQNFVESREHDRIGMTIFAKNAFLQFPLTLDYRTIQSMLGRLELGDISEKGTAIGNAIGRAVSGLKESEAKSKILILITDGNRQGGNIAPMKAAEIAKELDIKIFPILVGQDGTTFVPDKTRTLLGGRQQKYKRTKFPVDPELLKKIAEKTGGKFYEASDKEGLTKNIHDILDQFERVKLDDSSTTQRNDYFPVVMLGAVFLLFIQGLIRYRFVRRFP